MRRLALLLGSCALIVSVALPASAHNRHHHGTACGKTRGGWEIIYDGSKRCFERWRYAGGSSITRQRDGTLRTGPGAPNLGVGIDGPH